MQRSSWKKHHLAAEDTIVRVSAEKDTNPPQMNNFRIRVEIPLGISDQHREEIEQVVGHCLIHNTSLNSPRMSMEIKHLALQAV